MLPNKLWLANTFRSYRIDRKEDLYEAALKNLVEGHILRTFFEGLIDLNLYCFLLAKSLYSRAVPI